MNKRAHKNSNKCIKNFYGIFELLASSIIFYILLPSKYTFSQAKPNFIIVSSETPFSKNSYIPKPANWSIKRIHWLGSIWYGFYRRVFRNRLEYTFFPQKSKLIIIIPIALNSRSKQSIDIVFVNSVLKKSVYSKHSKNTKSRSYPRFSSLREKMLLGIWTCNRESIDIWHKSKFCNQNFCSNLISLQYVKTVQRFHFFTQIWGK